MTRYRMIEIRKMSSGFHCSRNSSLPQPTVSTWWFNVAKRMCGGHATCECYRLLKKLVVLGCGDEQMPGEHELPIV
jgi:hypothetical protein